jgi:hypothetical protein
MPSGCRFYQKVHYSSPYASRIRRDKKSPRNRGLLCFLSDQHLLFDYDLSFCGNLAVEFLSFIGNSNSERFLITIQLEIIWYTPRVPACAASAKGHGALDDHLAVGTGNHDGRIERLISFVCADDLPGIIL